MTVNLSPASPPASFKSPLTGRAKRLVIGNWKMNGSLRGNEILLKAILEGAGALNGSTQFAVCAPFPYLFQVREMLVGSSVSWGAQDLSVFEKGAYTGEVAGSMLLDFECRWVIVGHSERRALHGETNQQVADKALAALKVGLTPVFCVGESLAERDAGQVNAVIERQLAPLLALGADAVSRVAIAYEPVWAIGTGRTATPEQAQDVHAFIRAALPPQAREVPLLYGGSVKPELATALFEMADIDGGLIGGASLVASDFLAIGAA